MVPFWPEKPDYETIIRADSRITLSQRATVLQITPSLIGWPQPWNKRWSYTFVALGTVCHYEAQLLSATQWGLYERKVASAGNF